MHAFINSSKDRLVKSAANDLSWSIGPMAIQFILDVMRALLQLQVQVRPRLPPS